MSEITSWKSSISTPIPSRVRMSALGRDCRNLLLLETEQLRTPSNCLRRTLGVSVRPSRRSGGIIAEYPSTARTCSLRARMVLAPSSRPSPTSSYRRALVRGSHKCGFIDVAEFDVAVRDEELATWSHRLFSKFERESISVSRPCSQVCAAPSSSSSFPSCFSSSTFRCSSSRTPTRTSIC